MIMVSTPARGLSLTTIVWLLGITQVVGYGTMYYSLAIVAPAIAAQFSVPMSSIYAALSLALLGGGAIAPYAGKLMDRRGAAAIMAWGSVAASVALGVTALAPTFPVFAFGLLAVEVAGALVLYDSAFAYIVQNGGPGAGRRITHLTLIAGFASTIFWPLTSALHGMLSWREVIGVFVMLHLLCCLPIHVWLARAAERAVVTPSSGVAADNGEVETPLSPAVRRRALVLVALGFALSGFLLFGIVAQLVPTLAALGLGTAGVVVAMLFGPAQVIVRFVNMVGASGRHPLTITLIHALLLPVAVLVLLATAPSAIGAAAFALLFGFGAGLKSIVQGTLPLALFGREAYAERLGRLASVRLVLISVAPFVMAYLTDTAGVSTALLVMTGIGFAGMVLFLIVARMRDRERIVATEAARVPA